MSDVDALIARKHELGEQLRRIDEAADTTRDREPGDLPVRGAPDGGPINELLIDGAWYLPDPAIELTRAGLHEVDVALDALGAFDPA